MRKRPPRAPEEPVSLKDRAEAKDMIRTMIVLGRNMAERLELTEALNEMIQESGL